MNRHARGIIAAAFILTLIVAIAQAAERPFYQGKTVTFFINFSAGGPTDIEGRIVARHLARFIPGSPTIVVQNMSGGGGVTGINFLGFDHIAANTLNEFFKAVDSAGVNYTVSAAAGHFHNLGRASADINR